MCIHNSNKLMTDLTCLDPVNAESSICIQAHGRSLRAFEEDILFRAASTFNDRTRSIFDIRFGICKGLVIAPKAPLATNSSRLSADAVNATMGVSHPIWMSFVVATSPFMTGMDLSMRTMSMLLKPVSW